MFVCVLCAPSLGQEKGHRRRPSGGRAAQAEALALELELSFAWGLPLS